MKKDSNMEENTIRTQYLVIGNSAAGIGAVQGIRSVDPSGQLLLLSDEPHHTYSRPLISYWLQGRVDADLALAIVAVVGWRYFAGTSVPRDAQGRPTRAGPAEAQSGFQALQGIHQQGVQPGQPAPAGQ